ncbi:MAG: hydantoinase/carbamoylase family amidase [Paracoccaceae bacterium]
MTADLAARASARLAALAACSAPGPGVTRLPFTPAHRAALAELTAQREAAGLSVRLDAAGTLIGRCEGPPGAPVLLLGSHQDSVREGGAYDGIMGVVLPILALEVLRDAGVALPFAVEVLAFADEEGVRFPTALIGPRALAGTFDPAVLDMEDADGTRLGDALRGFGGDPGAIAGLARDPGAVLGYVETHIEQGPVLEAAGDPLGVVTAICGIERHPVTLTGETGHAGTLPMEMRRDALVGAAALVTEVDRLAGRRRACSARSARSTSPPARSTRCRARCGPRSSCARPRTQCARPPVSRSPPSHRRPQRRRGSRST